ncbi:RNase adapter RapZ [Erysipelothrix urinaevulpis]|uniref:RNase adapter RapZ n=1 Tax=Erysipelothrix urinaevulpis TaxID=2683717 RepID=UPI001357D926|nr:RNase adapter RapZ [Erysipelothrix urinaevulpis]
MKKNTVVLVTGLSGAGKTSSMAVLEDLGYHCIDRFPETMVDELINTIHEANDPRYQKLALSVTAVDFKTFFNKFKNTDVELVVLFLDASKEQLLLRYKYNRRNHPLIVANMANSLDEAIDAEVKEFSNIKGSATIIIDTSFLSLQNLTSRIKRFFTYEDKASLAISFISFGYRKGLPMDADLVFDVRFLNNPYWEEHLRDKSGNDLDVYSYVMEDSLTKDFLEYLLPFLNYAFERYVDESKHHLTVAIGCTGGQHRSVSLTNFLYKHYRKEYKVFKTHRDVVEFNEQ